MQVCVSAGSRERLGGLGSPEARVPEQFEGVALGFTDQEGFRMVLVDDGVTRWVHYRHLWVTLPR